MFSHLVMLTLHTRQLMETELTLEYGKKFNKSRVIHQELLCCHSPRAVDLFKKAKGLREAYPIADELRKELKKLASMSEKTFDENHLEKTVRHLHYLCAQS